MQLESILKRIKVQQDSMGYTEYIEQSCENRMDYVRDLSLATIVELVEMLQHLPWKPWKRICDQPYNQKQAIKEFSDVFVFVIDIFLAISPTLDLGAVLLETLYKIDKRIAERYGKQTENNRKQQKTIGD